MFVNEEVPKCALCIQCGNVIDCKYKSECMKHAWNMNTYHCLCKDCIVEELKTSDPFSKNSDYYYDETLQTLINIWLTDDVFECKMLSSHLKKKMRVQHMVNCLENKYVL